VRVDHRESAREEKGVRGGRKEGRKKVTKDILAY